jgi:hypothetical protein
MNYVIRLAIAFITLSILFIPGSRVAQAQTDNRAIDYVCYDANNITTCSESTAGSTAFLSMEIFGLCQGGQTPYTSQYAYTSNCSTTYSLYVAAEAVDQEYLTEDGTGYFWLGSVGAISQIGFLNGVPISTQFSSQDCYYNITVSGSGTFVQSPC